MKIWWIWEVSFIHVSGHFLRGSYAFLNSVHDYSQSSDVKRCVAPDGHLEMVWSASQKCANRCDEGAKGVFKQRDLLIAIKYKESLIQKINQNSLKLSESLKCGLLLRNWKNSIFDSNNRKGTSTFPLIISEYSEGNFE